MTPTTKAGPKSVKFMAIAQLDNNAYFSMHGMFKKKSTVFSLQHTHAPMSMHCQVSSKHMSVGGNKKKKHISGKNANIVSNKKCKNSPDHI